MTIIEVNYIDDEDTTVNIKEMSLEQFKELYLEKLDILDIVEDIVFQSLGQTGMKAADMASMSKSLVEKNEDSLKLVVWDHMATSLGSEQKLRDYFELSGMMELATVKIVETLSSMLFVDLEKRSLN